MAQKKEGQRACRSMHFIIHRNLKLHYVLLHDIHLVRLQHSRMCCSEVFNCLQGCSSSISAMILAFSSSLSLLHFIASLLLLFPYQHFTFWPLLSYLFLTSAWTYSVSIYSLTTYRTAWLAATSAAASCHFTEDLLEYSEIPFKKEVTAWFRPALPFLESFHSVCLRLWIKQM